MALSVAAARAADPTPANPRFTGSPFMQVWATDELGAAPVNRAVIQHPRSGFIYVANHAGVLEFDGVRWQLVPVPGTQARALAIDARERLWFLSTNAIGRIEASADGGLRAVSAMNRLPEGERALGRTVRALAAPEGIYFCSLQNLIFFPADDAAPAQVWPLPSALASTWRMNDAVHVALVDGTWHRVLDGKLTRVATGQPPVFAARREPDGSTTLLTPRGPRRADAANPDVPSALASEPPDNALILADGRFAFGTAQQGVLLFDAAGRFLQRIDRDLGLLANRVESLYEDREGGLWIALHNGLARVQLDSPFASHGFAQRLHGTPHAVTRLDGRLYVAHSEGVAVSDERGAFQPVTTFPGGLGRVLSPANDFFLSTALLRLPAQRGPVADRTAFDGAVALSTAPGMFALGAAGGVFLCRAKGDSWERLGRLEGVRGAATPELESPADVLWISGRDQLRRVDFRAGVKPDAPVRIYGEAEGVPPPPRAFFMLGGQFMIRTRSGIVRYDAAADRFVPDARLAGFPPGEAVSVIGNDNDQSVWIKAAPPAERLFHSVPDGPERWKFEWFPTEHFPRLRLLSTYHDTAARTRWLCVNNGLVSMDLDWRSSHPAIPLAAVIRRVTTLGGGVIASTQLPATQTALRFEFAAPAFQTDMRGRTNLQFRSRLEGLDADWSSWSAQPFREVTNLPFGALRLRVQARELAGRESPEVALALVITTPWWRTSSALAGFGALGLLLLAGFVRLRTRALHRRAAALEAVVAERTATLHAQNEELSRLHRLELDENASLRHAEEKARLEVLRYQLNPHFLYNSLNSIYGLLFENARGAGEMVLRLSEFCRATLTMRDGEQPTLGSEFEVLRVYLEVEKVRWGEGLQVEFAVSPDVASDRLPPFLLLPLVENAVKYGGRTSPGTLRLRLSARRDGPSIVIEIANSGLWLAPDPARTDSTGLGLENLRERLRRHYPAAHVFTIEAKDGQVIARLRLDPAKI